MSHPKSVQQLFHVFDDTLVEYLCADLLLRSPTAGQGLEPLVQFLQSLRPVRKEDTHDLCFNLLNQKFKHTRRRRGKCL